MSHVPCVIRSLTSDEGMEEAGKGSGCGDAFGWDFRFRILMFLQMN